MALNKAAALIRLKPQTLINWHIYSAGLLSIGLFALTGWLLSLFRNNVTHVDSMWSFFWVCPLTPILYFLINLAHARY